MKVGNFIKPNQYSYSSKDKWEYIYYLDTGNITENRIDEIVKLNPLTDKIPSRAKRKVKKGNIIYSTVRPNQKHYGYVDKQYDNLLVSTGFVVIDVNEDIADGKYFYYWLTQEKNTNYLQTIAENTVATYPSIAPKDIENMSIELPALDIQRKIAKILSNYDDLLENNNKRIKILEEMAQKIYKEWFVDFKYPGHETATFKDTELGRIPSDWEVKTLKDTIDSIKETIKPGEHLKNLRYVPIDCIPRKSFFLTTSESYKNAQSSLILFKKSDILFGNMRSYFHKVILAPFDGITRTTCFVLRPKVDNYRSWVFLTMFQDSTVAYSSRNSKGATIPYSFWEDGLAEMKVIFPSTKIIKAFNDIINPMLENNQQGYFKQENLKQTRDLLLPRLMSGEINVEDLEIA